jgi:hypothetical protein
MHRRSFFTLMFLAVLVLFTSAAHAQVRPYIGYTYPAGGRQGTVFEIKLGGQNLDNVDQVLITGTGVTAKVTNYYRRLNNQELQLLNEQLKALKRATSAVTTSMTAMMMSSDNATMMQSTMPTAEVSTNSSLDLSAQNLSDLIEKRTREFVQTPACASISSLVFVEVTIAPDAAPGLRELRLATLRGISNPLLFHVGQLPEYTRKPMISANLQVLGKEAQALRKRPADEVEERIIIPCIANGQIASGEVNRYRFAARKGQRLVISTKARQLIPFIADAVPGWFQPVLVLYDINGREIAFNDDYRFRPDPTLLFEVPSDGEYVVAIYDSIYRGREDFVYRLSIGELPLVTSLFPLGRRAGTMVKPKIKGWNLHGAVTSPPPKETDPGACLLSTCANGAVSDPVPFAIDELPDGWDKEPNNSQAHAQKIRLPVVINGRIDQPDDWDVFQFYGQANDTIVAEVQARRLDSPLDSIVKLTDASGQVLAANDDHQDLAAGINTHFADSFLMRQLPADGLYFIHLGDTARHGGEEYGYRLRLSSPRPDFTLRVVPSSVSIRGKGTASLTVYALRKDGFAGPIKLALNQPPDAFAPATTTMSATQTMVRLTLKSNLNATNEIFYLSIIGSAIIKDKEVVHEAVPAEDRMQAFLWRHLVPAADLRALIFDPAVDPPPKRIAPVRPPPPAMTNSLEVTNATAVATNSWKGTNLQSAAASTPPAKPKFTQQQIAGRLRQLKRLYEEGLLTDEFYLDKVAECETSQ